MVYNVPNASQSDIKNVGLKIISCLYGGIRSIGIDLNDLRCLCFKKESAKKNFNLTMLPPTESAAAQHCYRVYYQVQQWLGNELNPKEWGWQIEKYGLEPIQTTDILLPDSLLKKISCKCTRDCSKLCGCIKHGLKCTDYCTNCHGQTCQNAQVQNVHIDEEISENVVDFEDIDTELAYENVDDNFQLEDEDINNYESTTSPLPKRARLE